MARNEKTGKDMASIASRAIKDPKSVTLTEIQSMGASLLTQAPDKKAPIKPKKKK
ncbi:hypothetical protein [Ferrovibrio sp.]|uniref:hypothetical protein n=1 Tax=Ferrovibrio sp. TaxID=1917215 RepID=UPI0025C5E106|nr:hypothetical protein [Ferrovibrio sp.]